MGWWNISDPSQQRDLTDQIGHPVCTSASAVKFDLGAVELDHLWNGTRLLRVIPPELVHDDDVAVEERLLQGREAALRLGAEVHPAWPCRQLANLNSGTQNTLHSNVWFTFFESSPSLLGQQGLGQVHY